MEKKNNSGALFKSDKKTTDKHPDYNGSAKVGDVEYYISAWINQSQKGKLISLSFKPKDQKPDSHTQAKQNGYQADDDLPF